MTIINKDILKAIDLIWNNKFQEAELIFEKHSLTTPRYSLHNAETAFLKSFITANESETEIALKRLKDTKELAESCIKQFESYRVPLNYQPSNIVTRDEFKNHLLDCKIVLGDSLYMLAVLQITRDHKLKGCYNLRKSWKIFEDTLKQVRDDESNGSTFQYSQDLSECLRFGVGFFYFAVSIIPQKYLKFLEIAGFKGDDLGLVYIRDCMNRGGIRTPFATMVLLFNNLLLPRGLYNPTHQLAEAQQLIEKNLEKYPNGSIYQVMGSHCYRKQCKIDLGVHCMELAILNCSTTTKPPLIYKYELANCYLIKMEWSKAITIFQELVNEDKFQIRALCGLQLASCYIMNGDKDRGLQTFSTLIKQWCKKSSSTDTVISKQASRYLSNGGNFSALEILYIRRDLAKMEKSIALKTLDTLNSIAKKSNVFDKLSISDTSNTTITPTPVSSFFSKTISNIIKKKDDMVNQENQINDRASYLMLKGAIYKSIDLYDQSMECFEELLSMTHLITEKYYIPYSLYEMSEAYFYKKNSTKSLEYLLKCNKISSYDWSDPLKVRLRVTLDQLKRDGANNSNGVNNGLDDDLFVGDFDDDDNDNIDEVEDDDNKNNTNQLNKSIEKQLQLKKEVFCLNKPTSTTPSPQLFNNTNIQIPSPSIIQEYKIENKRFPIEKTII